LLLCLKKHIESYVFLPLWCVTSFHKHWQRLYLIVSWRRWKTSAPQREGSSDGRARAGGSFVRLGRPPIGGSRPRSTRSTTACACSRPYGALQPYRSVVVATLRTAARGPRTTNGSRLTSCIRALQIHRHRHQRCRGLRHHRHGRLRARHLRRDRQTSRRGAPRGAGANTGATIAQTCSAQTARFASSCRRHHRRHRHRRHRCPRHHHRHQLHRHQALRLPRHRHRRLLRQCRQRRLRIHKICIHK
jgi:hypothetical protein